MALSGIEEIACKIVEAGADRNRVLIAITGAPGAGKSLLSEQLLHRLPADITQVVPMDGFHYDDGVLNHLGLRSRKGAPETFDFEGLEACLRRLRNGGTRVAVPVFDRTIELSRAGGRLIEPDVKYVLVEGNYLLLGRPKWSGLRALFDLSIFIDVPRDELVRRLMARWLGLGRSEEEARAWVENNDMKNVDLVVGESQPADLVWHDVLESAS